MACIAHSYRVSILHACKCVAASLAATQPTIVTNAKQVVLDSKHTRATPLSVSVCVLPTRDKLVMINEKNKNTHRFGIISVYIYL